MSKVSRDLVLGIDPGLKGAFCFLSIFPKVEIVDIFDAPTSIRNNKHELDIYELGARLSVHAPRIRFAVFEDVGVMSGVEGRVSMFNFGKSTGAVIGALGVLGVPIHFVRPAVWKMLSGLTHEKAESRTLAQKTFPTSANLFSRAKDDGRAEAALLAAFGVQRFL